MEKRRLSRCTTCGQELRTKEALVKVHSENLTKVLEMIDSGKFFAEDFPQLKELQKLLVKQ